MTEPGRESTAPTVPHPDPDPADGAPVAARGLPARILPRLPPPLRQPRLLVAAVGVVVMLAVLGSAAQFFLGGDGSGDEEHPAELSPAQATRQAIIAADARITGSTGRPLPTAPPAIPTAPGKAGTPAGAVGTAAAKDPTAASPAASGTAAAKGPAAPGFPAAVATAAGKGPTAAASPVAAARAGPLPRRPPDLPARTPEDALRGLMYMLIERDAGPANRVFAPDTLPALVPLLHQDINTRRFGDCDYDGARYQATSQLGSSLTSLHVTANFPNPCGLNHNTAIRVLVEKRASAWYFGGFWRPGQQIE